jgi:hypothetical protein
MSDLEDRSEGLLDDRYQIYLGCLEGTGITPKTYDEWLES